MTSPKNNKPKEEDPPDSTGEVSEDDAVDMPASEQAWQDFSEFDGDDSAPIPPDDTGETTAGPWSRKPTKPRYQPPNDSGVSPAVQTGGQPRYRRPTEAESDNHRAVDTSPFHVRSMEQTPPGGVVAVQPKANDRPTLVGFDVSKILAAEKNSASERGESSSAESASSTDPADAESEDGDGPLVEFLDSTDDDSAFDPADDLSGPIVEFLDDEAELAEAVPDLAGVSDSSAAETDSGPVLKPTRPRSIQRKTMLGLEGVSPFKRPGVVSTAVHSAKTIELTAVAGASEALDSFQRYLERLSVVRPGPGGMGQLESRTLLTRPHRFQDLRLQGDTLLVLEDGRIKRARSRTPLASAIVEALASAGDTPVLLTSQVGLGKSHTLASLASAIADTCLLSSDSDNAFDGLTVALAQGGLPAPIALDLAAVATLGPTKPSEFLTAYQKQHELPTSVLEHSGPVIVVADNLDTALALGTEGYDPFGILCELLENRPNWRAIVATGPLGPNYLSYFSRYGKPITVIEILPMQDDLVAEFVDAWSAAYSKQIDGSQLQEYVPATITHSPRLLTMLLSHWDSVKTGLGGLADSGVSGICELLTDGICETVHERAAVTQHIREDLRTLAEVASGLPRGAMRAEDVRALVVEGFARNNLEALLETSIVRLKIAKGDRSQAEVSFAHSLFQEVLLAEKVINETIRSGLARNLKNRAQNLTYIEELVPFNERQVLRAIEVADSRVRALPLHLLGELLDSLENWLVGALFSELHPATRHFPRMLGIAWLVAKTVRRVAGSTAPPERLDGAVADQLQELLLSVGEGSLFEAVNSDWTSLQMARSTNEFDVSE